MSPQVWEVDLQHFSFGPTMRVKCCPFSIVNPEQISLFHKTTHGWDTITTTAFTICNPIDDTTVDTYVWSHVEFFLRQAQSGTSWLDVILNEASTHTKDDLIRKTLSLWSAHRLLMQGWQLTFPGSLGMLPVVDQDSFLFNTTPAPRVLQNQLDQILEQYCAKKEMEYLKALQGAMRKTVRRDWITIFASSIILLHTRERDIWRLLYWTLDTNNTYTWRHPESAPLKEDSYLYVCGIMECGSESSTELVPE
ncbi:hypothetical protein EJ07DRAFT_152281 [Lizonia empirigonia]|nr:hypothetical protein EJ07DRAFT_152281 [Lizonia empirigonia]